MASPLPPSLRSTLEYFAKYNYPLTADELYFWQHGSKISKLKIKKLIKNSKLKIKNLKLRQQREKFSTKKWKIAKRAGESLKKFPTIAAVFVTGALAMHNCPADDDIDIMIVTFPNTLWMTRFFVNLYLNSLRRHPEDKKAPNKICPNLWLDSNHLQITPHDLYRAHEISQAKILWDRAGIHGQFLRANSWVKKFLPVAYRPGNTKFLALSPWHCLLWPLNLLFFLPQYLYMKPKMTSEKVGLGFAFFHPTKSS